MKNLAKTLLLLSILLGLNSCFMFKPKKEKCNCGFSQNTESVKESGIAKRKI